MQALGENTESNLMVSLIQSKLPTTILTKLKEYKNDPWTVEKLRTEMKRYVAAQKTGNRFVNLYRKSDSSNRKSDPSNDWKKHQKFEKQSIGTFAANERNNCRCYYCNHNHWSDECKQSTDIKTRKGKESKGHCFICLRKSIV